jgi:putative endonuclease
MVAPRPPRKPSPRGVAGRCAGSSMFYTYVLQSVIDDKLYIGFFEDLKKRIKEHIQLIYYEACLGKNKAIQREKYFKSGFGRKFLKMRI